MRSDLEKKIDAILVEIDPERLIAMGAPKDEYEPEVKDIYARILKGEQVTAEMIRNVWQRWFGNATNADGTVEKIVSVPMRESFKTIADRIRKVVQS